MVRHSEGLLPVRARRVSAPAGVREHRVQQRGPADGEPERDAGNASAAEQAGQTPDEEIGPREARRSYRIDRSARLKIFFYNLFCTNL